MNSILRPAIGSSHIYACAAAFGIYSHLGTDVMLFAAVLVVPPHPLIAHQIRKHSTQRFNAMFTPAVVEMVRDIAQQTLRDSSLGLLSRSATIR